MREQILAEIKRLAAEIGKAPGVARFTRETGIPQHVWYGVIWPRWSDALADAGLASNSLQTRFESTVVLRRLAEVSQERGRVPTTPEMKIIRRSDPIIP